MFPLDPSSNSKVRARPSAIVPFAIVTMALVLAALGWHSASAGPWTLNRGGYYASSRLSWLSSDSFYDAMGVKQEIGSSAKFKDRTVRLGAEYGLRDKLTLELGLPVRFLALDSDAFPVNLSNSGIGDARVGLRYRALDGGANVASVQVDGEVPTGYNEQFGVPPLGEGASSLTLRALAGRTFDPRPVYAQAEFGYSLRGGNFSNLLVAAAQAGFWASTRVLVLGEWTWQEHRDDEKEFEDFFRYGGQVQYRLKPDLDLIAGVNHVGGGQNTFAGTALILGVALKGNTLGAYRGPTAAGVPEAR